MKKAILFDLDGTLIDSAPDLAQALNETLDNLGMPTFDLSTIRGWIGGGASMLVRRALSGSKEPKNVDPALFKRALEEFMKRYEKRVCDKTVLYPGVEETLAKLQESYHLALVTNKPDPFIAPILQRLDLHVFDQIVGGDTLDEKKPSPKPLLHVCKMLQIEPKEALMVGDTSSDYLAAKAAGIDVVLVDYGYEDVKDLDATIIDDMKKLLELV